MKDIWLRGEYSDELEYTCSHDAIQGKSTWPKDEENCHNNSDLYEQKNRSACRDPG